MKTLLAIRVAGELLTALENHIPDLKVLGVGSRSEFLEALAQAADTRMALLLLGDDLADSAAADFVRTFEEVAGGPPAVIRILDRAGDSGAWQGNASRILYLPIDIRELCKAVAALGRLPLVVADPDAQGQVTEARRELWERHRGRVEERIAVLGQAAAAMRDGTLGWTLRGQARGEAHNLAGSLGSVGFAEGSRIARELEQFLLSGQAPAIEDVGHFGDQVTALLASLGPGATTNEATPRPRKIVIVDADPLVQALLVEEARAKGLEPVVAVTPGAARLAFSTPCDAVILDPQGPAGVEDGLELLRDLGTEYRTGPVIVATGQVSLVDRLRAVQLGAAAFLPKPVAPGQVISVAMRAIEDGKPGGAAILAVDDDQAALASLEAHLASAGHRMTALSTPLKFWAALEGARPDLIILDFDMPVVSGIELCRVLRNDPGWRHLPVLFMTADHSADTIGQIFAAGADDFVAKPIAGSELLGRIRNRLERSRLPERGQDADPISGVVSGRRRSEALTRLLDQADRSGQTLAFAVLEIDQLRTMKSHHGRDLADDIVCRVGELLVLRFPGVDVVSRWSEQFVVGLLGVPWQEAIRRLKRVQEALHAIEFEAGNRHGLRASFSGGVAQYPEVAANLTDLFRAADRALGEAQAGGGGKVVRAVWHPSEERHVEHLDVVVVEDDGLLADLVTHELRRRRLTYRLLMDGRAALDGLTGTQPSLAARAIVLDLNLPLIDGMALLERLRREGVLKRTKVLVSTSDSGKDRVLKALELGATDYLVKPYSLEVLMEHLNVLLTPPPPPAS